MDYFDQKGKHYTTYVNKRTALVRTLANGTLITGTIHLMLDNRVKDELNTGEHFIAVTHAQVTELASGKVLAEDETLILNKDHIVWMIPCEQDHESQTPNPTPGD